MCVMSLRLYQTVGSSCQYCVHVSVCVCLCVCVCEREREASYVTVMVFVIRRAIHNGPTTTNPEMKNTKITVS